MKGRHRIFILVILVFLTTISRADDQYNNLVLKMPRCKGRVYELLDMVSRKIDKTFIYDSDIIDNNKKGKIENGSFTLQQLVRKITGDNNLELKDFGSHLLIVRQTSHPIKPKQGKEQIKDFSVLKGRVIDKITRLPLAYTSVYLIGQSIASVTNGDGEFRLVLSDSLSNNEICFSHIGYMPRTVEVELLNRQNCTIELQEHVTTLQEIVVRLNNPIVLLDKMQNGIRKNYSSVPVYFTSFYREGVESDKKFVKLNEGVFKIYKPSVLTHESDRVMLLKKRTIVKRDLADSVNARIRAGIDACLQLDIIKTMPEFVVPTNINYKYFSTGITTIDGRTANIIYFEQRNNIDDPLYSGELYIDSDTYALLGANIEINPKYVKSASDMFVERKSKHLVVTMEKVSYRMNYKLYEGHYYTNYVRGDIYLNTKSRKRIFGSSHKHLFFEMATCKIDTANVTKLQKEESYSTRNIFEETSYQYDNSFWGDLNIIPVDESLENSINKLSIKIEESQLRNP